MNDTLADLQDRLVRLHARLRDRLGATDDDAERQALVTEMTEVTHRVQLVGGLLFAAEADELDAKVREVKAATKAVNAAIARIGGLKDLLDAMSGFLGLVDEAIDLAKTLAA